MQFDLTVLDLFRRSFQKTGVRIGNTANPIGVNGRRSSLEGICSLVPLRVPD